MEPTTANMILDPTVIEFISQSFSFFVGAISASSFVLAVHTRI